MNTVWTLIAAFLVFGMQVGFVMLEAGFARSRESVNILVEGIADPTRPTSDGSEIGHHPLELRVRERSYERSHRDQVA